MKAINNLNVTRCFLTLVGLFILLCGCKKLVDVNPPTTALAGNNVFNSDATAAAVLTGVYAKISQEAVSSALGIQSLSLYTGLSSDEFALWSGNSSQQAITYYRNKLLSSSSTISYGQEYWTNFYGYIFKCNDAIVGLNNSDGLSGSVKQQLLGESRFLRGFYYFYLTNLYGDVPLALTNDYKINESLPRSAQILVYQQIIADLQVAQRLLSSNYLDGTLTKTSTDRVRPTKWAATALLARTYLYTHNYAGADSAATAVINNSGLFALNNLQNAFLRSNLGNKEAIWQLQPVNSSPANTYDALSFIIPSTGFGSAGNFGAYLNTALVNNFESGDNRKTTWTGNIVFSGVTYYYPYKYKVNATTIGTSVTEHEMMLRLAEQYLIRAEARAQLGNISGSQTDLNIIRTRAGLSNSTAATQTALLTAIQHENQAEFFCELGHRWFDLKRTGTIDAIMSTVTPQKYNGGTWQSYQQLYPLPFTDLQLNANLKQNTGY